MTAGTSTTHSQHAPLEALPTRWRARAVVAVGVVGIVAAGLWGALSAVQGVQAYEHTKRLESGLEQARYALALERGAVRESQTAHARAELRAGSLTFATALRVVRKSGGGDAPLAAALRSRHDQFLAASR